MVQPGKVAFSILQRHYSDISSVLLHPIEVAGMLFQEGFVSEETLSEVTAGRPAERKAALMRAMMAAVKGECGKLRVVMAVLEKFAESYALGRVITSEIGRRVQIMSSASPIISHACVITSCGLQRRQRKPHTNRATFKS